jgi:cullin 1
MEGMMKDLLLSEDHKKHFSEYFDTEKIKDDNSVVKSMEFDVQILTMGFWPTYKSFEPSLPEAFSRCKELFTTN